MVSNGRLAGELLCSSGNWCELLRQGPWVPAGRKVSQFSSRPGSAKFGHAKCSASRLQWKLAARNAAAADRSKTPTSDELHLFWLCPEAQGSQSMPPIKVTFTTAYCHAHVRPKRRGYSSVYYSAYLCIIQCYLYLIYHHLVQLIW